MRIKGEIIETMDGLVIDGDLSRLDVPTVDVNGTVGLTRLIHDRIARLNRTSPVNRVRVTIQTNQGCD